MSAITKIQTYDLVLPINNKGVTYNKKINLTCEQYDAVMAPNGNCLVIASAGAGKTRVLISKVSKLLLIDKVKPEHIVLLTYTTNAAHEMKERLTQYTEDENITNLINIGTVHSYALKTLEKHFGKMAILDPNESKTIITQSIESVLKVHKSCCSFEEFNKMSYYLKRHFTSIIDKLKTDVYSDIKQTISKIIHEMDLDLEDQYIKTLISWSINSFNEYERYKKTNMLVDFNDLLDLLYNFLLTSDGKKWVQNIHYLLVDEFQDVNPIQMKIIQLLNTKNNLTVVGDDAQSIYAFRGGKVEYINQLHRWVNNLKRFYLKDNYRSSKNIVDISQLLINTSNETTKKEMIVKKECNNAPIKIVTFNSEETEIYWIINDIVQRFTQGVLLNDICILCRWNKQLHNIEHYLDIFKLNYINMEQNNIWNKPYMSTMISIMKIVLYNKNGHYWKLLFELINKQKEFAKVWETIKWETNPIEQFMTKYREEYGVLVRVFEILQDTEIKMSKKIVRLLNWYFEQKPIYDLREEETIKREVKIIRRAIKPFDNDTIEQFIQRLSNMEIKNQMINNPEIEGAIILSTLHRSKGLEFKHVYMMHCNEDYLKSSGNYIEELKHWEEERRLLFVGLTRAIDTLTISGTNINSYIYNSFCKMNRSTVDYLNEDKTNIHYFCGSDNLTKHIDLYFKHYSYYGLVHLFNHISVEGYRSLCRIDYGIIDEINMWTLLNKHYPEIKKLNKWYKCYTKNVICEAVNDNILVYIDKHTSFNYRKPSCEVIIKALLYLFYLNDHVQIKNKVIVFNPWLGLKYTITIHKISDSYKHFLIRRINFLEPLC
jgi:DNA helicase-2/ATP-dependent DNA helicase PcrA